MPVSLGMASSPPRPTPPASLFVVCDETGPTGEPGGAEYLVTGRGPGEGGCRVGVLKEAVARASGIAPELQTLWQQGRPLADEETPSCAEPVLLRQPPPPPPGSCPGDAATALRSRVWALYRYYAPRKLDDPTWLDSLLSSWRDSPDALWDSLLRKYGPWPPPPPASPSVRGAWQQGSTAGGEANFISLRRSRSRERSRRKLLAATAPLSPRGPRSVTEPALSLGWQARRSVPAPQQRLCAAQLAMLEDYLCHRGMAKKGPGSAFALRSPRAAPEPPDEPSLAAAIERREREVARLKELIREHEEFLAAEGREIAEHESRREKLQRELDAVAEFRAPMPDSIEIRVRQAEQLLCAPGSDVTLHMTLVRRETHKRKLRRAPSAAVVAAACVAAASARSPADTPIAAPGWGVTQRKAKVREGTELDSPEVRELDRGVRVRVLELKGLRGRIGDPCAGWLSVQTQKGDVVVTPGGRPVVEAPPPKPVTAPCARARVAVEVKMRTGYDVQASAEIGRLSKGTVVEVVEVQGRRARVADAAGSLRASRAETREGWITTQGKDGTVWLSECADPVADCHAGGRAVLPVPLLAGHEWGSDFGAPSPDELRAARPKAYFRRRPYWIVTAAAADGGAVVITAHAPMTLLVLWPESAETPEWLGEMGKVPGGRMRCAGTAFRLWRGPRLEKGKEWKGGSGGCSYAVAVAPAGKDADEKSDESEGSDSDDCERDEERAWLRAGARVAARPLKWRKGYALRTVKCEGDLLKGKWWVVLDALDTVLPGKPRAPMLFGPEELAPWPPEESRCPPKVATAAAGGASWEDFVHTEEVSKDADGVGLHFLLRCGTKGLAWGELCIKPNHLIKARQEHGGCLTRHVRLQIPADDCEYTAPPMKNEPEIEDEAPEPLGKPGQGVVVAQYVRVRKEPMDASEVIGKIPKGTTVTVASAEKGSGGALWLFTEEAGETKAGWVRNVTSAGHCALAEYIAPEERQRRKEERRKQQRLAHGRQHMLTARRRQKKAREDRPRPAGMLRIDIRAFGGAPLELPLHCGYAGPVAGRADTWSLSSGEQGWAARALSIRTVLMMKKIAARARARVALRNGESGRRTRLDHCPVTGRKFMDIKEINFEALSCVRPLYDMGGQPHLLWAAPVVKHGLKKGKLEKRTLVLTPQALYVGERERLRRCIELSKVRELIIASGGWMGVRVPSEYDLGFQLDLPEDSQSETDLLVELLVPLCRHHSPEFKVLRQASELDTDVLNLRPPKGWSAPPMAQIEISTR
eukprot:TRINITY_DN30104_c0_g1_i1.p1 TRINITY_DN30104_c0_g1~~TRINITY_DN30104_c0_g1_i1.p1  ORF type:complete len:1268 (+),score=297.99 TRINITY_DN30104_c0_g1_i1:93-3896(+)